MGGVLTLTVDSGPPRGIPPGEETGDLVSGGGYVGSLSGGGGAVVVGDGPFCVLLPLEGMNGGRGLYPRGVVVEIATGGGISAVAETELLV